MRILCLLVLACSALLAADVTGRWSGDFEVTFRGQTRPDSIHIELKQDGPTITGTAGPNSNRQWKVENGRLEGTKLTFDVPMPEGPVMKFDLAVDGERLHGKANAERDGEKMNVRVDVKRVK